MIIIQSRQNSKRFPNKWRHEIDGVKIIDRVYQACEQTTIRPIVFAVPAKDFGIRTHCDDMGYNCYIFEGDENDLIKRFLEVMVQTEHERCLRITCDCAFHFPQEMSWVWEHGKDVDFCSNGWPSGRTTIDGCDCETYSLRLLRYMDKNVQGHYREHLPLWIYDHEDVLRGDGFHVKSLNWPINLSHIKTSIDSQDDIERMRRDGLI